MSKINNRHIIGFICLLTILTIQATTLSLSGRVANYDSTTGTWLCSVPQSAFENNWRATIHIADSHWTDIKINDTAITNDSDYTFVNISQNQSYVISALDTISGQFINQKITFTFLPIVHFYGDINNEYSICCFSFFSPDDSSVENCQAKIKYRGATTNLPDRNKRNYHIKFINVDSTKMDRQFFGLRNDNSWLLDAGQIDMSRIRNRVATELWMDMVSKPYYAGQQPKALLGVRGNFVEVFVNNQYQGFYSLTETLDRKQLKLAKYDEDTNAFHGMLWKTKSRTPITMMTQYFIPNNNDTIWSGFEPKYPDPDDVLPTDYSTLANAIDFVANSSNDEFKEKVGDYFDIPVIMDYWILINTLLAVDNGIKNIYWAVYDQTQDKKITLAAWDMDCTVGQNWKNNPFRDPTIVSPHRKLNDFNNLLLRLHELNPDSFCIKTVQRYQTLRSNILNVDSLYNRYAKYIQLLQHSGAAQREIERWSGDSDLDGHELDFDDELAYIKQWLEIHLPYLDQSRFRTYIKGDVNRDGVVDVFDVNYLINKLFKHNDYPVWYEDLNPDYKYDIADINKLISIVINR